MTEWNMCPTHNRAFEHLPKCDTDLYFFFGCPDCGFGYMIYKVKQNINGQVIYDWMGDLL